MSHLLSATFTCPAWRSESVRLALQELRRNGLPIAWAESPFRWLGVIPQRRFSIAVKNRHGWVRLPEL